MLQLISAWRLKQCGVEVEGKPSPSLQILSSPCGSPSMILTTSFISSDVHTSWIHVIGILFPRWPAGITFFSLKPIARTPQGDENSQAWRRFPLNLTPHCFNLQADMS